MTKEEAFESILKMGKANFETVITFLEFSEQNYMSGIYQKEGEALFKQVGAASGCGGLVTGLKAYQEQVERNKDEKDD